MVLYKQHGGVFIFKILIVEDDRDLNRTVCTYLNRNGYDTVGYLDTDDHTAYLNEKEEQGGLDLLLTAFCFIGWGFKKHTECSRQRIGGLNLLCSCPSKIRWCLGASDMITGHLPFYMCKNVDTVKLLI